MAPGSAAWSASTKAWKAPWERSITATARSPISTPSPSQATRLSASRPRSDRVSTSTLIGLPPVVRQAPGAVSSALQGQVGQQLLEGDQSSHIGTNRLSHLAGQAPQRLVTLCLAHVQHPAVCRAETAAQRQGGLDQAAQPGFVERHLLDARVAPQGVGKGVGSVLVPEPPQPGVVLALWDQSLALS